MRKKEIFRIRGILLLAGALALITSCEPPEADPETEQETEETEAVSVNFDVYAMDILVEGNAPVVSKEKEDYMNCTVSVDGKGRLSNYYGTARIRGRGNSSWLWYDKKPYRIKLDVSSGILGLKKNKDWVLLANYRDPTNLMNAFGFEVADWLGLPYTNHSRFVEVTLNGDYIGLYQLTEQVEQGGNRVNIDETDGFLICLDVDDGPYYCPNAGDNFWSTVFELPVCVKHPDEPTTDQVIAIRNDFAELEEAINNYNYDIVDSLMNIPSFIDYLIVQELVYNVEIDAPRSVFIHKDKGGKYVMGPVWDFDAGFDFDWSTMYTGHNFFNEQELVLGTDPVKHTSGYRISGFFTQMFRNHQFVSDYKARWNEIKDSVFEHAWAIMEEYEMSLQDAMARNLQRWPIDKHYNTEIDKMEDWLSERVPYLTTVINSYPAGTVPAVKVDCGMMACDVTMSYQLGYQQTVKVMIDESLLLSMLEITSEQLYGDNLIIVPLRTDGSEGMNNTNGIFGAWFEADNNPGFWANGHVYIEVFDNLTVWDCGLRAEEGYCSVGEKHSVQMQYQYTQGTETKTVTVAVNFTIAE
ncbi:MAG: CotH kinase family protein [Bacteroidales bacterium]|nr:CotH kinase family protein [Bacteroidales bacterium]